MYGNAGWLLLSTCLFANQSCNIDVTLQQLRTRISRESRLRPDVAGLTHRAKDMLNNAMRKQIIAENSPGGIMRIVLLSWSTLVRWQNM